MRIRLCVPASDPANPGTLESVSFVLGIVAALAAAVLYSVGVTLQSVEARLAPEEESLRASLIKRLVTRRRWLGGTGCVVGGWATQVTALTLIPITIVQPALAVSVLALLFIGVRFFGESITRREVGAGLAILVGVGGLAAVSPGHSSSHAAPLVLGVGLGVLAAVALVPYAMRGHHRFGTLVAVSAGLAYAWTGFSTKFVADGVSSGHWPPAVLWLAATATAAGVGLLSEMTALQARSAINVFPVVLVVQIVVLLASLIVLAAGTRALAGARGRAIATMDDEAEEVVAEAVE